MTMFENFSAPYVNELLKESSALDAEAGVFYGDILEIQGKVKDAERHYGIAAGMGSLVGIERIGFSLQQRGKSDDAITWLQQAVDFQSEKALLPLAKAFIAINQLANAEKILDKAAESTLADSPQYKVLLAWEFFGIGNYPKAIQNFEAKYQQADQQDGDSATKIAEMYLLLNQPGEARRWINEAKVKVDYPIYHQMLEGDCFFAEGKFSEALKNYLEITSLKAVNESLEEDDIFVGLRIAKTYKVSGDESESRKWTGYAEKLANRAATYVFSEYWEDRMPSGQRRFYTDELTLLIISLNLENETSKTWSNWGICDFRVGRFQSAIRKFENALEHKNGKTESEASFFLMHIYSELGQPEKSNEMKARNNASGGYSPSDFDRDRLKLLKL